MAGPTVATLTWNTALREMTTIRAASPMLKESQFRKAMCCKDPFIWHSGKGKTVGSANMGSVRTIWGQHVFLVMEPFCVLIVVTVNTNLYMLKLLEPYICMHTWVNFCVSSFFFFLKGERGHFLKTSAFGGLPGRPAFKTPNFQCWRRKWQPTPIFLPGESQGQSSLVGCHQWGHTESDMTEAT